MSLRVYVETSILSYLTARPSRDVVVLARQQLTRAWWDGPASGFSLYGSEVVLEEASAGDPQAAAARLAALGPVPLLRLTDEARALAGLLIARGSLPAKAVNDAFHVAIAAAHGMDFLLTWNCKHIANAAMRPRIEAACREAGARPVNICTPEQLMDPGD